MDPRRGLPGVPRGLRDGMCCLGLCALLLGLLAMAPPASAVAEIDSVTVTTSTIGIETTVTIVAYLTEAVQILTGNTTASLYLEDVAGTTTLVQTPEDIYHKDDLFVTFASYEFTEEDFESNDLRVQMLHIANGNPDTTYPVNDLQFTPAGGGDPITVVCDLIRPTATWVTPVCVDCGIGATFAMQLDMSEAVDVTGGLLTIKGDGDTNNYSMGTPDALTGVDPVVWTVASLEENGLQAEDGLDVISVPGTFADRAGNTVVPTTPDLANEDLLIDTIRPTAAWETPVCADCGIGATFAMQLDMSEAVDVTGGLLTIKGDGDTNNYSMGTPDDLTDVDPVVWTVASLEEDGLQAEDGLDVISVPGTFADQVGNTVVPTTPDLANEDLLIDTIRPTAAWETPVCADCGIGATFVMQLNMSEAVDVTGGLLTIKGDGDTNNYSMGTPDDLTDVDPVVWTVASLEENGLQAEDGLDVISVPGTFADQVGNTVVPTTPDLANDDLLIDTIRPVLDSAAAPAGGNNDIYYGPNRGAPVTLEFSEDMYLPNGEETRPTFDQPGTTSWIPGPISGAQALECSYTPSAGADDGSVTITALEHDPGASLLADRVGNEIVATGLSIQVDNLQIDTTVPLVTAATGTDAQNPYYGGERTGHIRVTFSELVELETGSSWLDLRVNGDTDDSDNLSADRPLQQQHTFSYEPSGMPNGDDVRVTGMSGDGGMFQDRADNPIGDFDDEPVDDFEVDNTDPTIGAMTPADGSTFGATPSDETEQISIAVSDNVGISAQQRRVGDGTWTDGTTWNENIWDREPLGDAGVSVPIDVRAWDLANNFENRGGYEFYVDNARVGPPSLDIEDPFDDGESDVIPAGYPVSCTVGMQNLGRPDIPTGSSYAELTVEVQGHGDQGITSIGPFDLPANGADEDLRIADLELDADTPEGEATVTVGRRNPWQYDETASYEYDVASSDLLLGVEFPDTVAAGDTLSFTWTLRQLCNGGVASQPRVRIEDLDDDEHLEGPDDLILSELSAETLVSCAPARGPYPSPTGAGDIWVVDLTADDGVPIPISQTRFSLESDQIGEWQGPHEDDRVTVALCTPEQDPCEALDLVIRNCVLSQAISLGEVFEDHDTVTVAAGETSTLYYCVRNLHPDIVPNLRLELAVHQNDAGRLDIAENPGWVAADDPPPDSLLWVYDPQATGDAYPYWMESNDDSLSCISLRFSTGIDYGYELRFVAKTDRRPTMIDRVVAFGKSQTWIATLCREVPAGEEEEAAAGSELTYRTAIKYIGATVDGYLRVSDAASHKLEALAYSIDGATFTPMTVEGSGYRSDAFTCPADQEIVRYIRGTIRTDAPDGSPAGLRYPLLTVINTQDDSDKKDLTLATGCADDVRVQNVQLRVRLEVPEGTQFSAGGTAVLQLSVENTGRLPVDDSSARLEVGESFADWVVDAGDAPLFENLDGLEPGGSIAGEDWEITIANCPGNVNEDLSDVFASYDDWQLFYQPIRPTGGFDADDTQEFTDGGERVRRTSPVFEIELARVPPSSDLEIPQGSQIQVTVSVTNTSEYQGGEFFVTIVEIAGLTLVDGELPHNDPHTVGESTSATATYGFAATGTPGTEVDFSGRVTVATAPCDVPESFVDNLGPFTIIPPAIGIAEITAESFEVTAGEQIQLRCEVENRDDDNGYPLAFMIEPPRQEPDSAVSISAIRYVRTGQPTLVAAAYEFSEENPIVWSGGSPDIGAGGAAVLEVDLDTHMATYDSSLFEPGLFHVMWGPDISGRDTGSLDSAVVIRNVRFSVVVVSEESTTIDAGGPLDLAVDVRNDSDLLATTVTCSVRVSISDGDSITDTILGFAGDPKQIPAGGQVPFDFDLQVDPQTYTDGAEFTFAEIWLDAFERGIRPRFEPGDFEDLPLVTARNIDLVYSIRRLDALLGEPHGSPSERVTTGEPVYYGIYLQNEGSLSQTDALEIEFRIPPLAQLGSAHPDTAASWTTTVEGLHRIVTFSKSFAPIAPGSGDWLVGGYVPAFTIETGELGSSIVTIRQRIVEGHVPAQGGGASRIRRTTMTNPDPADVDVLGCSPTDLTFELHLRGSAEIDPGNSIALGLKLSFPSEVGAVPGFLDVKMGIRDGEFRFTGVRRIDGDVAREWESWDEDSVSVRSMMLDDGRAEEFWEIDVQRDLGSRRAATLVGNDIVSFAPYWTSTAEDPPCQLETGADLSELIDGVEVDLEPGGGEVVGLFARPNPAGAPGREEMSICYDLLKGATSVRLFVMSLAGDVVMAASIESGMTSHAGLNCLTWRVAEDQVPNGVYLGRLEVDGVDADGNSMRETRRVKLAVLR